MTPALGLLAGAVGVLGTLPYLRDTVRGTTRPHRGTWLAAGGGDPALLVYPAYCCAVNAALAALIALRRRADDL